MDAAGEVFSEDEAEEVPTEGPPPSLRQRRQLQEDAEVRRDKRVKEAEERSSRIYAI